MLRRSRMSLRAVLVALVVVASALGPRNAHGDGAAHDGAEELVDRGDAHARDGDLELAVRRYADALRLDPACKRAYLALGEARERMGDLREAERTYAVALDRVPSFVPAMRARARVLRALGRRDEAVRELETAARVHGDLDVLTELAAAYVERSAWPAALATFRRIRATLAAGGSSRRLDEVDRQVRALSALAAELDPVRAGGATWERRALASIARRTAATRSARADAP